MWTRQKKKACIDKAVSYLWNEPITSVWDSEQSEFVEVQDRNEFIRLKTENLNKCKYLSDIVEELDWEDRLDYVIDMRYVVPGYDFAGLLLYLYLDRKDNLHVKDKEGLAEALEVMREYIDFDVEAGKDLEHGKDNEL